MEFYVKLIEVNDTKNQDARDSLYANCTHVAKDFWLFEGDSIGLHDGIDFKVIGEQAMEGLGDMSGSEIKKMVDRCFFEKQTITTYHIKKLKQEDRG